MLVFDRRSLRCVVPPTEDCDVPSTLPPPTIQDEELDNIPQNNPKNRRPQQGQQNTPDFPNLPPGAIPITGKRN